MKVRLTVETDDRHEFRYNWEEDPKLFVVHAPFDPLSADPATIYMWQEQRTRRMKMIEALSMKLAEAMIRSIEEHEQAEASERIRPIRS